jgi:3-hydroxy-9,10-secoandrosta-1,3,5(10)-triene-9,17-dione monooxygenase reductase component
MTELSDGLTISDNGHFAVNMLTAEQEAISRFFASRNCPRGPDAFAEIPHRRLVTGAPTIDEVAAYLDCSLVAEHQVDDHTIFIGEVLALGAGPSARSPLLYFAGSYRTL